jgi:hypothetical protein
MPAVDEGAPHQDVLRCPLHLRHARSACAKKLMAKILRLRVAAKNTSEHVAVKRIRLMCTQKKTDVRHYFRRLDHAQREHRANHRRSTGEISGISDLLQP